MMDIYEAASRGLVELLSLEELQERELNESHDSDDPIMRVQYDYEGRTEGEN